MHFRKGIPRCVLTNSNYTGEIVKFWAVAEVVPSHDLDSGDDAIAGKDQNVQDTHEKHEFVAGVLEEFMLQHRQKEGEIRQLKLGIYEVVSCSIYRKPTS